MKTATQHRWRVTGKNGIEHTVTASERNGYGWKHPVLFYYCTCPWHRFGLSSEKKPCQHVRAVVGS